MTLSLSRWLNDGDNGTRVTNQFEVLEVHSLHPRLIMEKTFQQHVKILQLCTFRKSYIIY